MELVSQMNLYIRNQKKRLSLLTLLLTITMKMKMNLLMKMKFVLPITDHQSPCLNKYLNQIAYDYTCHILIILDNKSKQATYIRVIVMFCSMTFRKACRQCLL